MKYKALILDVDGTLIQNSQNSLPSEKVIKAVEKASEKIHVGVATARPLFAAKEILKLLKLSGPSIINGGAQVIDASHHKVLWERAMDVSDTLAICHILSAYYQRIYILDKDEDVLYSKDFVPHNPLQIYVPAINKIAARELIDTISQIPSVSAHTISSWKTGKEDIVVNHAEATKQHGVFEVAKLLKIDTKHIIGVGDSYNDFPLLMACGLKIAMGSAPESLKDIADYIAPTVEKDGVVKVIEKFILKK